MRTLLRCSEKIDKSPRSPSVGAVMPQPRAGFILHRFARILFLSNTRTNDQSLRLGEERRQSVLVSPLPVVLFVCAYCTRCSREHLLVTVALILQNRNVQTVLALLLAQ